MRRVKAQITAVVIVGILLLAIVAIAMLFRQSLFDSAAPMSELENQINSFESSLRACEREVSAEALKYIARNGLYFETPQSLRAADGTLWLAQTIAVMPTDIRFIQDQVQLYVDTRFSACVPLASYRERGWDIEFEYRNAQVEIGQDAYVVTYNYDVSVERRSLAQTFSGSIFSSDVDFIDVYQNALDVVNTQLLAPDFEITSFLGGYQTGNHVQSEVINDTTVKVHVSDGSGIELNGEPLTISFVAHIDHNNLIREYERGSIEVISPDRRAVLLFPEGAPTDVTVTQYMVDSVVRRNTPIEKFDEDVVQWGDQEFQTDYPIYRFGPNGLDFSDTPGVLFLFGNFAGDVGLLYNGRDGWIPFPHEFEDGAIVTPVFGFSEYAAASCEGHAETEITAGGSFDRFFLSAWLDWGLPDWLQVTIFAALIALGGIAVAFQTWALFAHGFQMSTLLKIGIGASMAYTGYAGLRGSDGSKTQAITALCDTTVTVTNIRESGGSCRGYQSTLEGSRTRIREGDTFNLKRGETLLIRADLEDFDPFKHKASCRVTVSGKITTHNAQGTEDNDMAEEEPIPEPEAPIDEHPETGDSLSGADLDVGCCAGDVCSDNALRGTCQGNFFLRSCSEITTCEQYSSTTPPAADPPPVVNPLCAPIGPVNESLTNVVLAPYNYQNVPTFENAAAGMITRLISADEQEYNYFMYKRLAQTGDSLGLEKVMIDEACDISSANYVFLDPTDTCSADSPFYRVTPDIVFKPSLQNVFNDFCSDIFVVTDDPPAVTINSLPETATSGTSIPITFAIEDIQYPLEYNVVVYPYNASIVPATKRTGTVQSASPVSTTFSIHTPGAWTVLVEGVSHFGVRGFSENKTIAVTGLQLYPIPKINVQATTTVNLNTYVEAYPQDGDFHWSITDLSDASCIEPSVTAGMLTITKLQDECSANFRITVNDLQYDRQASRLVSVQTNG